MSIENLLSENTFLSEPEETEDSGWGSVPSDESDYITKGDEL